MIFRVLVYNIYEMKVKELIEKLQEFDGDLETFYDDAEY